MSTEPSPTSSGEPPSAGGEDVPARKHRLPVIAVAAAVLVAGGGGAWWASTAEWGSVGADKASEPPRLALDGLASAGRSGEGDRERPGIAPGEPHPQVYRANGALPDGPDNASVYRNPSHVGRASVAALADALGVKGKPQRKDGRWIVGEDAESPRGTALVVNDDRMAGNWTFRSADRPVHCARPLPTVPQPGIVPPENGDAPNSCSSVPGSGKGDPVSEKKAEDAVRPLLKTLKLEDARTDAGVTTGPLRMVTATPEVGGMPAKDWNSTFTVNEDGKVVLGHGNLGELRKGASYPVMSAEETLKHLNKQGAAGSGPAAGTTVREPWAAEDRAEPGKSEPGKSRPGQPDSGKAEPARPGGTEPGKVKPRRALKVTGAEFGLVTRYTAGKPVLVPSWIYEVRFGGDHTASVAHPAIEPEYLEPAGPAQPGSGTGSDSDAGPGSDSGAGTGSAPGSGRAEEPGPAPGQAVTSYAADGRTVKLTFWGGVCDGYEATAEESGSTVKVTVRPKNTDPKKVCVKMAERQTVEVELDKPLGDRKVVDATDGESLPRK
ncbi:hypothetical protein [Streptomyces sp. WMMB 322]|uniref:hypothetical protein n=1 Tax=Streptomyces sp. WMMB 322 TaxID=1286821 RepID=UPI0006E2315D|nr:hypothetical protein [Streptomyces sp. WMMB 322]SCK25115.1 hypothetical protein H180DRAFT_01925 [Streptomyces sp. WMMB 322]